MFSRLSIFMVPGTTRCVCFTTCTAYLGSAIANSLSMLLKKIMSESINNAQPLKFISLGTRKRVWLNSVVNGRLSNRSVQPPVGPSTSHGRVNSPAARRSRCFRYLIFRGWSVRLRMLWAATSEATASRLS